MIPELSKLCRTCLAPNKDLISIFDEEEPNNYNFTRPADIIGNLTNMPTKSDGLPQLICIPCSNEIKTIRSFAMKCINSECILRKILDHNDKEKMMLPNDGGTVVEFDKLSPQNQSSGCENTQQFSSVPSGFLIIKAEEPSCSFFVEHPLIEAKRSNIIVEQEHTKSIEIETHQSEPTEVFIKEEPSLSAWSDENAEPEEDTELKETNTGTTEDGPILNIDIKNHVSEPELTKEYANINEELVQKSDKEVKSKLKCPNCNKLFMHLARLKRHIKTHKYVKPTEYACPICTKKYNRQFSLQRHCLVSHKLKLSREIIAEKTEVPESIKIEITKESDNVEIEVKQPIIKEICNIEAMRQCNRCKEVFENDEDLAIHKKSHTIEKAHICEICHKAFSFRHNLKIHIMSHKKIKPFKCEQCNQRFVRNSCLTRHLKTHTGDRPFECELCGKAFTYMQSLKIHKLSHKEDRPYSCTLCSMQFKLPSALKEHHRTHTGEKPYSCTLCPRQLSSKTNLRIHMKTHP